ncbi:MAG TPA: hypothetical protein VGK67_36455 [Myxococcales bacterium]|jgi:hypothetical protein
MRRIAVKAAAAGVGAQATDLGEIDNSGIAWGNGRGQLRGAAVQQLVTLLGDGYLKQGFVLIVGQQGLGTCRVLNVGRVLDFSYDSTFLAR